MSEGALDLDHLRQWVGRSATQEQHLEPFAARALAGLLDRDAAPVEGDALPLLWHWLYFLEAPSRAGTGVDGHPRRGGFLPPVPLPRRMWAAGELTLHRPLRLGRNARKTSTVRSVDLKQGKAGALVFVTVAHELTQDDRACISELQHIVYREAPTAHAPLPPGETAPTGAEWSRELAPDTPLLFRYSALTYNGHRIHYDRDYATQVEFYPGLVVHGPLLATLLLDLAQRERPGADIRNFSFRAMRPAFEGAALQLCGTPTTTGAELWTSDAEGFTGMKATATFA
ncbi:MAG: MaoC family dehydratase N-terminal domain-containing protein [Hydrogenophaga sp.]|uniref:FAS1-like dehydratase domain-containing protein n=1 Tax=Hydrogenophaga sp. TaxID=1904254 RepID=UPI003D12171E